MDVETPDYQHHCISMYPSGVWIDPVRPDNKVLNIQDIALSLAQQCRYNGACMYFYSVAQHCVNVSKLCQHGLWGLLHDAPEMVLGDIVSPLKHAALMAPVRELEAKWMKAVAVRFGLYPRKRPAEVKATDRLLMVAEMRRLKPATARQYERDLLDSRSPDTVPTDWLESWSVDRARAEFLSRYLELKGGA